MGYNSIKLFLFLAARLLGDERTAAQLRESTSFQLICKAANGSTASVDILFFFVSMHEKEEDFYEHQLGECVFVVKCQCVSVPIARFTMKSVDKRVNYDNAAEIYM